MLRFTLASLLRRPVRVRLCAMSQYAGASPLDAASPASVLEIIAAARNPPPEQISQALFRLATLVEAKRRPGDISPTQRALSLASDPRTTVLLNHYAVIMPEIRNVRHLAGATNTLFLLLATRHEPTRTQALELIIQTFDELIGRFQTDDRLALSEDGIRGCTTMVSAASKVCSSPILFGSASHDTALD